MKHLSYGIIGGIIVSALFYFLSLPVLALGFLSLPVFAGVFGLCVLMFGYIGQKQETMTHLHAKIGGGIITLGVLYLLIGFVFSTSIFHAETKQQMLTVEEVVFDESVPNVDMDNLVILDEKDAIRFSEKLITEKDPSLGSMYSISEEYGTLSVIDDKPFWLFPLEHNSFMKYLSNKTIPGYIKVNATTGAAEFVDKTFSYAPSAIFSDDLTRKVYSEYKTFGITDYSFEEDNEGNPQWVITAYKNKTGFGTHDVLGVVVVDPVTGHMNFYKKGDQPDWVDRVSSVDIFDQHLRYWGKYVNGFWNPSDAGKLKNTDGIGYVFKDGNIYFYTGITSYGGDEATTGFMIYNPRTLVAQYNKLSGSTEKKAMGLMEELVQNAGYTAKYPYLVNINGEATYLSTLKGDSGNVVGYALASVKNYRAVAWGKTLREAQTEYNRALIREGSGSSGLNTQFNELEEKKGKVSRVGVLKEGYFLVKIEGVALLFVVSSDQFPEVALTEKGDSIQVSYLQTEGQQKIDAIKFINKSID